MSKPKYKAVIFDFDDTLAETRLIKWAHHKAVAKKFYNIYLSDEIIQEHWGKPFNVLVRELYKNSDTPEKMLEANSSIRHEFLKKVYPGAVEAVNAILDAGIKVGLLSAANKEFIEEDLARLGFPIDRFTVIQGPQDTDVHKPDPGVFIPLLEKFSKLGIEKENMVYVGDSLMDFQAAHGAGIDFVGVTTGLYSEEDFIKAGAKVVIKNIKDIVEKVI